MRQISFALTERQFLDGSKDVTRRLGWRNLKPGDRLMAVRKAQGLKRGEHPERLGEIVVLDVRREPLNAITQEDCAREGFPNMTPYLFKEMFCRLAKCTYDTEITRIEFIRSPLRSQIEYDPEKYPMVWLREDSSYHFTHRIPCRVVGFTKNRVRVAALRRDGSETIHFVGPDKLKHEPCHCFNECRVLEEISRKGAQ